MNWESLGHVIRILDSPDDRQDEVHEIPAGQVDHEQVERPLDALAGEDDKGDQVDLGPI
jgi:hypothetical protein